MADDLQPVAMDWLRAFAAELGVEPPSADEVSSLLALAGTAAHASHRQAAPVACWLSARAGVGPADALVAAKRVAPPG